MVLKEATQLVKCGEFEKALVLFKKAGGADGAFGEGICYYKLGHLRDAAKAVKQCKELNPNHSRADKLSRLIIDAARKKTKQQKPRQKSDFLKDESFILSQEPGPLITETQGTYKLIHLKKALKIFLHKDRLIIGEDIIIPIATILQVQFLTKTNVIKILYKIEDEIKRNHISLRLQAKVSEIKKFYQEINTLVGSKKVPKQYLTSLSLSCKKCKEEILLVSIEGLYGQNVDDIIQPVCPKCSQVNILNTIQLFCPNCKQNYVTAMLLGSKNIPCITCEDTIYVPTKEELEEDKKNAKLYKWYITPKEGDKEIQYDGLESLKQAIAEGSIDGNSLCRINSRAQTISLKKACDSHWKLKKLYDPLGVYCEKAGWFNCISAFIIIILSAVICAVTSTIKPPIPWSHTIVGLLTFLLAPTLIGAIITLVIAAIVFNINPIAACIGGMVGLLYLMGVMIISFLWGIIAMAIVYLIGKLTGTDKNKIVDWD